MNKIIEFVKANKGAFIKGTAIAVGTIASLLLAGKLLGAKMCNDEGTEEANNTDADGE